MAYDSPFAQKSLLRLTPNSQESSYAQERLTPNSPEMRPFVETPRIIAERARVAANQENIPPPMNQNPANHQSANYPEMKAQVDEIRRTAEAAARERQIEKNEIMRRVAEERQAMQDIENSKTPQQREKEATFKAFQKKKALKRLGGKSKKNKKLNKRKSRKNK